MITTREVQLVILAEMKRQGVTMAQLSDRMGVNRTASYQALREGANPTCATIMKMVQALGGRLRWVPKGGK